MKPESPPDDPTFVYQRKQPSLNPPAVLLYEEVFAPDPPLPHELNSRERFIVRFAFAEGKVLLLVPVGALIGYLISWLSDGRLLP